MRNDKIKIFIICISYYELFKKNYLCFVINLLSLKLWILNEIEGFIDIIFYGLIYELEYWLGLYVY